MTDEKPKEQYTISLVPPNRIREVWKDARPHLIPAIKLSGGRWKAEYVLASLVLGEQNLWVIIDSKHKIAGAATTQVITYPEKLMFTIHFMGGTDFDTWYKYLLDTFANYARDAGCEAIECVARDGFWKWFKKDGFKRESAFYEKKI